MIGYITLGTNDLAAAVDFYDQLFGALGGKRVFEFERGVYYGRNNMEIGILRPFDGEPCTVGNGSMVALAASCRDEVDRLHAKALALGATSEGEPGLRGDSSLGFYGAYFRDLDGNKLCVFNLPGACAE